MRKAYFFILLMAMILAAGNAAAEMKKPSVYPEQGQSKEQQEKDVEECTAIATGATGIDPDVIEMKMQTAESMLGRAEMPGPGGRLTLSPSQISQSGRYDNELKELERQYDVYLDAFSNAMKERGYKVKR